MAVAAFLIALAACVAAIKNGEHAASIIVAITGPLVPLAGGVFGALRERTPVTPSPTEGDANASQ